MKFSFYLPTRIISGSNCVQDNSGFLAELGKHAFIMTGKSSAEKNGSLGDMTAALESEGIKWTHFNGVNPNPSLEEVRSTAEKAEAAGADFIVALGGGSPMDAAKAVAVLAAGKVSDEELLAQRRFDRVLPLVAVPTTSGTGSEVTPYSILTNDKLQTKSFLNSEQVYPTLAFLDGRYTQDLPQSITSATVIDALSHAVEGYLAVRAIPLGQALAKESMSIIGTLLPVLGRGDRLTLDQRDRMLYASMLAGIVIAQSGTTIVHAMGYSLTYFKGLDHGIANGLILAEYLRFISTGRPEEVQEVLETLNLKDVSELAEYLKQILGETSLSPEEVDQFTSIAIKAGHVQNTDPKPGEEDIHQIFTKCFIK